jgi:hypothetical protein
MDSRLVGYWSEAEVHPGSTEYTELGFRADGSGWQYWSSWSKAFCVHRFSWHTAAPGRLTTRLLMGLDGTWSLAGSEVSHRVERWDHVDTLVELAWDLGPDQKLTLDEALGGTQFRPVEGGGTDPTPASVTP